MHFALFATSLLLALASGISLVTFSVYSPFAWAERWRDRAIVWELAAFLLGFWICPDDRLGWFMALWFLSVFLTHVSLKFLWPRQRNGQLELPL